MSNNNNNNNSNNNSSIPIITVGIDVGAETTKVTLGSRYSCEIVRNDVGGHTTPTAVSFQGKVRHMGETANLRGANAIVQLNRLLHLNFGGDLLEEFYMFDYEKQPTTTSSSSENETENSSVVRVKVDYNGERKEFSAPAVLAMLLGKIKSSILDTIQRVKPSSESTVVTDMEITYLLSVCPGTGSFAHQQLLEAAYAAGLEKVQVVETSTAYSSAYERKFPQAHGDGKVVMMIDMGHAQTTCSVVQFGAAAATAAAATAAAAAVAEGGNDEEKEEASTEQAASSEEEDKKQFRILAANSNTQLGAACVDVRLFHHFQTTMPQLKSVTSKSRAGQRLLQGTHKLKHLLSQLPDGSVTVENVGENNDTDVALHATRTLVSELCEPDAKALTELIQSTLKQANVDAIHSVEILGGGCRIPWVQSTIQAAIPDPTMTLSRSLDDTSAALGAALVGEQQVIPTLNMTLSIPDAVVLREQEEAMAALDLDQKMIGDVRNKMEAHILHLRSAQGDSKHGTLLPDNLNEYLDQIDDWLFSPECDDATKDIMEAKWREVQEKTTQGMCKDYFEAVTAEQKAQDAEMEEEAKKAQAENAAGGGENGGNEEDHDNRRLPKKRRMEIVMKNKEEANELFKDGNWRFAAARYTKALSHCAKFVDLSPEDKEEVNGVKLTLNLNLALAYMKLAVDAPSPNLDNALRVCNDAVALDESSAKALYRRASVYYEKKNWDAAKKDVVKAKSIAGDGDKAIQKLADRIELQLKKQKQKEKKMASKMFG